LAGGKGTESNQEKHAKNQRKTDKDGFPAGKADGRICHSFEWGTSVALAGITPNCVMQ
jgi:hypothetical protein